MKRLLGIALIGCTALTSPAMAAITVSQVNGNQAATTHSLGVAAVSASINDIGLATGAMRVASAADQIFCSDGTNNYTVFQYPLGAFNQTTFGAYFKYTTPLVGGTVSCTDTGTAGTNFSSATLNVAVVSGASGEDISVRNQNGSGSGVTNPTVTSNAGTQNGDLLVSVYSNAATTVGLNYTEDATHGWTQLGAVNGNTSLGAAQAYVTNAGTSGVIHAPGTASRTYGMIVVGFKDASVTPSTARARGALLGVGQ